MSSPAEFMRGTQGTMPTDSCVWLWECPACRTLARIGTCGSLG
jgi:hypothetical protein